MNYKKRIKAYELLRFFIQLAFLIVVPFIFSSAFVGVKEVFSSIGAGAELSLTPFLKLLLFLLIYTFIFGRFFCGYACAFGIAGEWIYRISVWIQKKTGKEVKVKSGETTHYLQCIKYVVLMAIAIICFLGYGDVINKNSPWMLFGLIISGKLPGEKYVVAGVLLLLIVVGMAMKERFFCQFLCPMGALFSLMPVLPVGQLKKDKEKCINGCSMCEKRCPVAITPGEDELRVGECLNCNRCAAACPGQNIQAKVKGVKSTSPAVVILEAAILMVVLNFVL